MKLISVTSLALFAFILGSLPVKAADSCKECRNFHQACLKAHSQAACKTDYDICMKHCKDK